MSIVRVGSNEKYSSNWSSAFGSKSAAKAPSQKAAAPQKAMTGKTQSSKAQPGKVQLSKPVASKVGVAKVAVGKLPSKAKMTASKTPKSGKSSGPVKSSGKKK